MGRDEAIERLTRKATEIRQLGATALFLFGSTARDEAGPDSDVDIFIDYDRAKFGFSEFFRIREALEAAVDRRVDLATRDSLHPVLRGVIEAEAVRIG